jgi:PTS system fructose-specific IIC component
VNKLKKIVAVTSCSMGLAHTYMAAEMLENKGKALGVYVIVETHGALGVENKLKEVDINDAIAVIIASDQKISLKRFNQKPLKYVSVKEGITQAQHLIEGALSGKFDIYYDKEIL